VTIQRRILEKNPGYQIEYFDDRRMEQWIRDHAAERVKKCFFMISIGAMRADLWRYAILEKNGGIYLDVDSIITGCLDTLIRDTDTCVISRENCPGVFVQWMLIFAANHPILKRVIDMVCDRIEHHGTAPYTWEEVIATTGPRVFTYAVEQELGDFHLYERSDDDLNQLYEGIHFHEKDFGTYAQWKNGAEDSLYMREPHWRSKTK
jgi:mannosyltransferase OCH1-like enzyme